MPLHVKLPKILFTMQWLVFVKSTPEDGTKIEIQREIAKLLAHQKGKMFQRKRGAIFSSCCK